MSSYPKNIYYGTKGPTEYRVAKDEEDEAKILKDLGDEGLLPDDEE